MVVEDSPTVRMLLVYLLGENSDIEVIGQASDGLQAVEMASRLRPDLITMDVNMPNMDGLEATRRIMAQTPTAILLVTSHAVSQEVKAAFEALKAGALDVMPKPVGLGGEEDDDWERGLVEKVKSLAFVFPGSRKEGL